MTSQTAECALRAVVYLGNRRRQPLTVAQISEATDVPPDCLAGVMQGLSSAGIVELRDGLYGGYALNGDPAGLTVLDVLTAVDAFHPMENCPLGSPAHTSGLCPLHRPIDSIMTAEERSFDRMTIGEILDEPNLFCNLPCACEPLGKLEAQLV